MSDKIYVGLNTENLDRGQEAAKITRVNLSVDSDHMYTSGNDTGRTVEVSCPWGTQAMADSILAKVCSVEYRPYEADDALLDPAAENGDGITIGGLYSVLAQSSVSLDKQCAAVVSAPYTDEIDDEYPYKTPERRKAERQLAQTRSLITKTAEEIRLEVSNQVAGLSSSFTVKLDSITARVEGAEESIQVQIDLLNGLTVTDSGGTTRIRGSSIETDTLYVNAANITGTLTIGQLPSTVAETGDIPTTSEITTITNNAIRTATIYASQIQLYGKMAVYQSKDGALGGYLGYMSGLTSDGFSTDGIGIQGPSSSGGQCLATTTGARISYSDCSVYSYSGGSVVKAGSTNLSVLDSGNITVSNTFRPSSSSPYLGTASYPWAAVYATTSSIQTSDARAKHDIEDLPDKYLDMLLYLHPRRFKMNNGTSDRYHAGYIAQEVEEAMERFGIDSLEFGGFVKDKDADGNDIYMLRYEEFIAIHTLAVQRIYQRLEMAGI